MAKVCIEAIAKVMAIYPWYWQNVLLKGQWDVDNTAKPEKLERAAKEKSEIASDATNMLAGTTRILRFNTIIRRVIEFPTKHSDKITAKNPASSAILALLLAFNSVSISASCLSAGSMLSLTVTLSGLRC